MSDLESHSKKDDWTLGWRSGLHLGDLNSCCFGIIYAVVFGGVYFSIKKHIHEHDLESIADYSENFREWYLSGGIEMLERRVSDWSAVAADRLFIRVMNGNSEHLVMSRRNETALTKREIAKLPADSAGPDLEIGHHLWAVTSGKINGTEAIIQVGKDVTSSGATMSHLKSTILIAFFPTMLAGIAVSTFFTHRAFSPVRKLSRVLENIISTGEIGRHVSEEPERGELNNIIGSFNRLLERNEELVINMRGALDNVSHDFRTPLSKLHIITEDALSGDFDQEKLHEALLDCREQSENLDKLLGILMEVSSAETGMMKLKEESFSLTDLVIGILELYEPVAEEKDVVFTTDIPKALVIHGDRTRLGQMIANLVDNAVKFTSPRTTIKVVVICENKVASITVSDKGQGIHKRDQPYIWDRLYRTEASRTTPGMGLGLSFVKAIAEAHGGNVTVESEPNKGSTFLVMIPLRTPQKNSE